MKNLKKYALIAGTTLALPILAEVTDLSKRFANNEFQGQKAELVAALDNPSSLISTREDIQRNIAYIDAYSNTIKDSSRLGLDMGLLLTGFALGTGQLLSVLGNAALRSRGSSSNASYIDFTRTY